MWIWLPDNGLNTASKFIPWKFNDIDHTTAQDLSDWLQDSSRISPLILDIRRLDEFAASHLPNARHIPPETSDIEQRKLLKKCTADCSLLFRWLQEWEDGSKTQKIRM